jgi:hypothetical protein
MVPGVDSVQGCAGGVDGGPVGWVEAPPGCVLGSVGCLDGEAVGWLGVPDGCGLGRIAVQ